MKRFLFYLFAPSSWLWLSHRFSVRSNGSRSDHSSGREVVNDWMHGFREFAAVDRDRGLVYVVDASDPLAVKAFAIADGTLVGTFGGGEGEGPGELQAMVAASVAADGVLVSDYQRVNHWSSDGDLVAVWLPHVPGVVDVCALGDHMVVPLPDGALVRTPQGREIVLGEGRTGRALMWDSRSSIEQQATDFMRTQAVCMSDWVYILSGDRLVGYSLSGARKEVALPRVVHAGESSIISLRSTVGADGRRALWFGYFARTLP